MNKTVLITGASSGIGKALAEHFAADKYSLVLAARSVAKMETLAKSLQARHGVTVTVIGTDLETLEGAAQLHTEVKARGISIEVLVNNAGYGSYGEFKDTPLHGDLAMMQLNMSSLVTLSKLFMPDLLDNRGKLVNLASTAAFQPGPYMAVYYASKAFVLSFTEAIAEELSGTGVTVTAFCPGPTASGFQEKAVMESSALVKGKKLPSSEKVAAAGYRAMMSGQRVFIPGFINGLMAFSIRFTPRGLATWMVKMLSRPS